MDSSQSLQQHLAAIVENSDDAIITKNLDSIIQSWNRGAERLFGFTAEEAIGQPVTIIFPDGRQGEEADLITRIRHGERIAHYETIRQRKDGSLVPISLTVSPVRDNSGRIVGASKIARDITLLRQSEEQQQLLLSEMRHRVGNCFAVASGLLGICARQTDTVEDLVRMMQERFQALSAAHFLAVRGHSPKDLQSQSMSLTDLVNSILEPFVGDRRPRIEIENCPVSDTALTPLALVFYELCTNAIKYGGLSHPSGELIIRSERHKDRLRIIWTEIYENHNLNKIGNHEGFGTKMSEMTIAAYLDGSFQRSLSATGICVLLDLGYEKVSGLHHADGDSFV